MHSLLLTLSLIMISSPALAQAPGQPSLAGQLLPLVIIFVIFWFLIIRPQQKKMKEHRAMVSSVGKGDEIVTAGGVVAVVTKSVDEVYVMAKVADGVEVKVLRGTISDVLPKGTATVGESKPKAKKAAAKKKK